MKRAIQRRTAGALVGAFMVLGITLPGAQNNPVKVPETRGKTEYRGKQPAGLSNERRGDLSMARKSYDEAIGYYTRAIKAKSVTAESKPIVAKIWNKIGICYEQKAEYEKARRAFKSSIRSDRKFADAWNNMGTTYYLNRRPKKSIKFYRHAVKLSPKSASFHWNLGTSYFDRKKYKKAFGEYRVAIRLDPYIIIRNSTTGASVQTRHVDAKFYFYMAKIYASVGNAGEAVRYLERAMEEGFNKRSRILQDPDIRKISKDPAFVALMKHPPVAIKN